MPFGLDEGLSPGDFLLDGDQATLPKRAQATVFDGDPATPRKKVHPHRTQCLAHVYRGQTAGWTKMSPGT